MEQSRVHIVVYVLGGFFANILYKNCLKDHKAIYNPVIFNLIAEAIKLTVSVVQSDDRAYVLNSDFFKASIPGLLYVISNNLVVYQYNVETHVVTAMHHLKLPITLALRCVMLSSVKPTYVQVMSCILISIGCINMTLHTNNTAHTHQLFSIYVILSIVFINSIAGVVCERIYTSKSLWKTNQNLYTWGVVYNSILYMNQEGHYTTFQGISPLVVVLLLTVSMNGIMVSYIFKMYGSVVKLVINAIVIACLCVYETTLNKNSTFDCVQLLNCAVVLMGCHFYNLALYTPVSDHHIEEGMHPSE